MSEINIHRNQLLEFLGDHLIEKRSEWQKSLIATIKIGNWKIHRKYCYFAMIAFFILSLILLGKSISLSRMIGPQQNSNEVVYYLFSGLLFFVFAILSAYCIVFTIALENSQTYEDYLQKVFINIYSEQVKVFEFCNSDSFSKEKLHVISVGFVKTHFEFLIKRLENKQKNLDQASLFSAIFFAAVIICVFGLPSSVFEILGSYGRMVGLPSVIILLQALIKTIVYCLLQSFINNHIECISLLEKIEFTIDKDIGSE